jgi:predicted ester cyclase
MMSLRQPLLNDGEEPEKPSFLGGPSVRRVKAGLGLGAVCAMLFVTAKFSDNRLAELDNRLAQSTLSLEAVEGPGLLTDQSINTNLAALRKREKSSKSKAVVLAMDAEVNRNGDGQVDTWGDADAWAQVMKPYWTANMTYEFIYPWNKPEQGLRKWYQGELSNWFSAFANESFEWFIFSGDTNQVTIAAKSFAFWDKPFAGLPPPNKHVQVRDLDFYLLRDGKIEYNWCMLDLVDLMVQAGYDVLPPAKLPNGGYEPPRMSRSQLPAPHPDSYGDKDTAYAVVDAAVRNDLLGAGNGEQWHSSSVWYGPAGVGTANGREEYVNGFLLPLRSAFSGPAMDLKMLVCEKNFCGAYAYWSANHTGDWLGAAPCNRRVTVRFGMHFQVENAKIVAGWTQMDLIEMMHQMGVDLLSRGKARAFELMSESERKSYELMSANRTI